MILPPYYAMPGPREVVEHYRAISDAVKHPILLYNIPRRTGINLTSGAPRRDRRVRVGGRDQGELERFHPDRKDDISSLAIGSASLPGTRPSAVCRRCSWEPRDSSVRSSRRSWAGQLWKCTRSCSAASSIGRDATQLRTLALRRADAEDRHVSRRTSRPR